MPRILVAVLTAILLGGCHLLFPFHPAVAVDSGMDSGLPDVDGGKADGFLPDSISLESMKPDGKTGDWKLFDSLHSDFRPPDTHPPDTLKPDIDLCKGVTCNYGSCIPATGKCKCNTGYDGVGCDKCAFGYSSTYPTCNPLQPDVTVNIKCTSPCKSGSTVDVDVTFTNTVSYTVKVECVDSAACVLAPTKAGKIYIPPSTTQALSHSGTLSASQVVTVKWILGTPAPADVRFRAYAYGVPTTTAQEDNKSIATY